MQINKKNNDDNKSVIIQYISWLSNKKDHNLLKK